METIIEQLSSERKTTLTCYIQGTGENFGHLRKRPAILVIPGGAYTHWSERESDPVAFGYLKAGYQVFILRYTCLDKGNWPLPLHDYEQAMMIINDNSEKWCIDTEKIVSIGFSAGGHLAASGALLTDYRPKVLILGYSLLTDEIQKYAPGFPSPIDSVDENTPSSFIFATANDTSVSVQNSLSFAAKLSEKNVMFECHIYPYGKHGYSTADLCTQKDADPLYPSVSKWMPDSINFCDAVFRHLNIKKMY